MTSFRLSFHDSYKRDTEKTFKKQLKKTKESKFILSLTKCQRKGEAVASLNMNFNADLDN